MCVYMCVCVGFKQLANKMHGSVLEYCMQWWLCIYGIAGIQEHIGMAVAEFNLILLVSSSELQEMTFLTQTP